MTLERRTALVTGSGRNIGAAVALALAARGASVVVNVRSNVSEGERVVEEIRTRGGRATLIVADVSRSEQVRMLGARVANEVGAVDILVNNVGIAPMCRLAEMSDEFWDLVLRTSLSSAFYCIRAFVGSMAARRWGRIINIGGQAGLRGTKYKSANAAAKNGLIGLTRAVANEYAPHGITCNHVGPGLLERSHEVVYYEDHSRELDPDYAATWSARIPAGRRGTPEDVAAACVFLASDEAGYINGQTLLVNGGMMFV